MPLNHHSSPVCFQNAVWLPSTPSVVWASAILCSLYPFLPSSICSDCTHVLLYLDPPWLFLLFGSRDIAGHTACALSRLYTFLTSVNPQKTIMKQSLSGTSTKRALESGYILSSCYSSSKRPSTCPSGIRSLSATHSLLSARIHPSLNTLIFSSISPSPLCNALPVQ